MPIHEYECSACSHQFERLVMSTSAPVAPAQCPACQSTDLRRLLSVFAVSSEGTQQLNRRQGMKSVEKEQRDKAHGHQKDIAHHFD
jgi:putative FmdB family regulatory protein